MIHSVKIFVNHAYLMKSNETRFHLDGAGLIS